MTTSLVLFGKCHICGQKSHGKHFGAISCRACAAFFRRSSTELKYLADCKIGKSCKIFENGRFQCKKCRLNRCIEAGMRPDNFQYNRDKISRNLSSFFGRPTCILSCEPGTSANFKVSIDTADLIRKASNVLKNKPSKPYSSMSSLEKMTLNFENMRSNIPDIYMIKKFGKTECMQVWEKNFLNFAKWISHFDEFMEIPYSAKIEILKTTWTLFARLYKTCETLDHRRKQKLGENCLIVSEEICMNVTNVEIDVSWFSNYSYHQLSFFFMGNPDVQLYE